jgi:nitrate reductase alpha subunit
VRVLNDQFGSQLPKASEKPVGMEQRRDVLNQAVVLQAGIYKGRVAHQSDTEAVIITGKPVNHILHLILSVLTLGLWLVVWLIVGIRGGEKQLKLSVDEYGRVSQVGPY